MKLSSLVQKKVYPVTDKLIFTNSELKQLVTTKMLEMKKKELANVHRDYVSRETARITKIKEDLDHQKQVKKKLFSTFLKNTILKKKLNLLSKLIKLKINFP